MNLWGTWKGLDTVLDNYSVWSYVIGSYLGFYVLASFSGGGDLCTIFHCAKISITTICLHYSSCSVVIISDVCQSLSNTELKPCMNWNKHYLHECLFICVYLSSDKEGMPALISQSATRCVWWVEYLYCHNRLTQVIAWLMSSW